MVDYRGALPKSWRNISNLAKADKEQLRGLGWMPLKMIEPEVPPNHVRTGPIETITPVEVILEYSTRPMTDEEVAERDYSIWVAEFHREEIPRWAEDLYDALDPKAQERIHPVTRNKIARKKEHRSRNPRGG
jgi:hypothetical protein